MTNKKKNIIIGVLFFLFIISLIFIYYLVTKDNNTLESVTGNVIVTDKKYVIIESKDNDYLIENIKGAYNIGDEVKFQYKRKDIDKKASPMIIKISDEELIKAYVPDDLEEPDNSNDTNNSLDTNNTGTNNNNPSSNSSSSTTNNGTSSNNSTSSGSSSNNSSQNNTSSSNNTSNNSTNNSSNGSNNTSNNSNPTSNDADTQVLSYFNDYNNSINSGSITDSLKSGFITVVDFLFYNGTIKGHTFNDLTSSAKLKVLSMALYFDSKIDKYFPGYKESISNTASKIYTNVKERIVKAYLTITTSICNANSELCNEAKSNFQELKNNFGLTWELLKDIAGDGLANLKNWYEIWRSS